MYFRKKDMSVNWDKEKPLKINFKSCNENDCTALIKDGYAIVDSTKEKVNFFEKFMKFEGVYILLKYTDGSHKTIPVPLESL